MERAVVVRRGVMTEGETEGERQHRWKLTEARKSRRIREHNSPRKVRLIEQFEELFDDEGGNIAYLAPLLRRIVGYHSRAWARRAAKGGLRLSEHEFESAMWEEAWQWMEYGPYNEEFYVLETLELRFESRAKDVIKWAKRKMRALDTTAPPLPDHFAETHADSINGVEQVVARLTVSAMLEEPSLTDREKAVLVAMLADHDASIRGIAARLGLHHQQVSRALASARHKLEGYR